jgi:hypothetical protein
MMMVSKLLGLRSTMIALGSTEHLAIARGFKSIRYGSNPALVRAEIRLSTAFLGEAAR